MLNSKPKISVLIPVYNRSNLISHAIESVLATKYGNLEIIVSDNSSTDNTCEVVESYIEQDARITLLRSPKNLGPFLNWKKCLDQASGDFVHWLWSDDWIEPDFYNTLVTGMQNTDSSCAFTAVRIGRGGDDRGYIRFSRPSKRYPAMDLLREALSPNWTIPASPAAALLPLNSVKKHFYSDIPVVNGIKCVEKAIGPDCLMIYGALLDSKFAYFHSEPLAYFLEHDEGLSSQSSVILFHHYYWARCWWSRRMQLPIRWNMIDIIALFRRKYFVACIRGISG